MRAMRRANTQLSSIISALEYFDAASIEVVMGTDRPRVVHILQEQDGQEPSLFDELASCAIGLAPNKPRIPGVRDPLPERYPVYLLIETRGVNQQTDGELLEDYLSKSLASEEAETGIFARNESQIADLFAIREGITSSIASRGPALKFDLSFSHMDYMNDLVEETRDWLQADTRDRGVLVCGYGHLGDGNLHLNISVPAACSDSSFALQDVRNKVYNKIHRWTIDHGGSISAEHGLGQLKNKWLPTIKSPEVLSAMGMIREVFDPYHLMNPGRGVPYVTPS